MLTAFLFLLVLVFFAMAVVGALAPRLFRNRKTGDVPGRFKFMLGNVTLAAICLVAALLMASPAQASPANDIPRYDPERHCREVAEFGGGSSTIYNGCIDLEQDSYNDLRARWAYLPTRIRSHCDDVARFGGGSYQILHGCVQMEEEAAGSPRSFKF